jgi:hypothetical protein
MKTKYADILTGCALIPTATDPCVGILRLDTTGEPLAVAVTRKSLLKLAEQCTAYADELEGTNDAGRPHATAH